jgi:hypothetical protein
MSDGGDRSPASRTLQTIQLKSASNALGRYVPFSADRPPVDVKMVSADCRIGEGVEKKYS